eukprot:TRINITY_DN25292_c0_g1_i2.p1 TRINITY_DN25292_c0_g1~~TRINITY_DN25292_c0_g1_i2.p1  ORF type:complete len:114 (-),score=10.96 TRINITY_DN25292_c0_g1_i2:137-478(-)
MASLASSTVSLADASLAALINICMCWRIARDPCASWVASALLWAVYSTIRAAHQAYPLTTPWGCSTAFIKKGRVRTASCVVTEEEGLAVLRAIMAAGLSRPCLLYTSPSPRDS